MSSIARLRLTACESFALASALRCIASRRSSSDERFSNSIAETLTPPRSGSRNVASRQELLSHHAFGPLPAARVGSLGSSWLKQFGHEPAGSGERHSGARSTPHGS